MPPLNAQLEKAFSAHRAGNMDAATDLYRAVLAEAPEHPDALHMLGVIAQQKGSPELGLKLIEAALAKKPDMAMAWSNRALVLRVLGRREEALQSARQAIDLDEGLAKAWDLSGLLLREAGKDSEACVCHMRAVELQPSDLDFRSNYAIALLASGDLADAYKVAKSIETDNDKYPLVVMGNILKAAGYPERAIPYLHKAAAALPALASEINVNEAMAWLQIGEMDKGWALWQARPDLVARATAIPAWRGETVDHLLLYEEQGMGDALNFVRYIPLIRSRARSITLQITPVLVPLLASSFPDIAVLTYGQTPQRPDAQTRLSDLPAICKTTVANIPVTIPYLRTEEKGRQVWREKLVAIPRPRIGLVWGGNPAHLNNRNRSMRFDQLAPLLETGKGHFISLQKGMQKNQARLAGIDILDADPHLADFRDTAGLMTELDLLISVDTASVHLAGALGVPAWVLLPFDPDWRWLLGREDSLWYPTLRLFRQPAPRDWASVIARVQSELERFLAGDKDVLKPKVWHGGILRQNPQALPLV
jgi:tetratricopeptide (TPR) repeat protein